MVYIIDVPNSRNTRILRAMYIPKGEDNPNNEYRSTEKTALIEFGDMQNASERFPNGQFTTGYYSIDTFLSIDDRGLDLYGSEPEWAISAKSVKIIQAWLKQAITAVHFSA